MDGGKQRQVEKFRVGNGANQSCQERDSFISVYWKIAKLSSFVLLCLLAFAGLGEGIVWHTLEVLLLSYSLCTAHPGKVLEYLCRRVSVSPALAISDEKDLTQHRREVVQCMSTMHRAQRHCEPNRVDA